MFKPRIMKMLTQFTFQSLFLPYTETMNIVIDKAELPKFKQIQIQT